MLSVLIKSLAIAISVLGSIAAAYLLLPESRHSYMAALIDKDRLLERAPSPRLIFVGGSSVAMGIDSGRVEKALGGKWAVVNTGLHGGLGLHVMLSLVEHRLRPGDVIVLAAEYSFLYDLHPNRVALNEALGEYPGAWRVVSFADNDIQPGVFLGSIQKRLDRALGLLPEVEDPVYTRQRFSARGDLILQAQLPPRTIDRIKLPIYRPVAPRTVRLLNEFYSYTLRRDASVWLSFSPYPQELTVRETPTERWLEDVHKALPIPILSNPDDYLLPLDLFFDTVYHLNARGRQVRTDRLIADLQKLVTPATAISAANQADQTRDRYAWTPRGTRR